LDTIASVQYENITTQRELTDFCDALSGAGTIAFDTEFVSEDSYRPQLCLVQVAAPGRLAVIDAIAIEDMTPFWDRLAVGDHQTIAHAGRQELCFSLHAIGKRPRRLFDTQIAAGMVGLEYPAAYSTLVAKLLGKTLGKGETRSDWRRRPLSGCQIDYALQDVVYLEQIRDTLLERLESLKRVAWLDDELDCWQSHVEAAESRERWQSVSRTSGLPPRALAVVRALWRWREAEAQRQNRPPRQILRDDLIAELARRRASDVEQICNVRGMDRRGKQRYLAPISECIAEALALPKHKLPRTQRRNSSRPELNVLGQFLATALGSICRAKQVAPGLVGSVQDVRDFVAFRLGLNDSAGQPPALACGWRSEVVGHTMEDILSGKLVIRVSDPLAEQPLVFETSQKQET
jgi:ribonuclease D